MLDGQEKNKLSFYAEFILAMTWQHRLRKHPFLKSTGFIDPFSLSIG